MTFGSRVRKDLPCASEELGVDRVIRSGGEDRHSPSVGSKRHRSTLEDFAVVGGHATYSGVIQSRSPTGVKVPDLQLTATIRRPANR